MNQPFDDTPPTVAEAVDVLRDSLEADEMKDWRELDEARAWAKAWKDTAKYYRDRANEKDRKIGRLRKCLAEERAENTALCTSLYQSEKTINALQIPTDREAIAAVQHEIWAHWTRYQFHVCQHNEDGTITMPAEKVERWTRQANTPYSELTDKEQESDRHQADKVIAVLQHTAVTPTEDATP